MPRIFAIAALIVVAACAKPQLQEQGAAWRAPRLLPDAVLMDDGYRLPLRRWGDPAGARAIVLGLHGFNDYGNAFAGLGAYLAERQILTFAYDQRGFGTTDRRGLWAGEDRMTADLRAAIGLLRESHPELPLYLVGESMGGAVILAAGPDLPGVQGIVLIAPAVWSRNTMNPLQRLLLWSGSRIAPGLALTGKGLGLQPTDNLAMWRAYSSDPLVIKATRIDALWGVTNLMDRAAAGAGPWRLPILMLYGKNDGIVPKAAICSWLRTFDRANGLGVVIYENGWHMLTRDLQGRRVMADIAAWIEGSRSPAPRDGSESGSSPVQGFCAGLAPEMRESSRGSRSLAALRTAGILSAPD